MDNLWDLDRMRLLIVGNNVGNKELRVPTARQTIQKAKMIELGIGQTIPEAKIDID